MMSENNVETLKIVESKDISDPATPFVFDDADTHWHLTQLAEYCSVIPYQPLNSVDYQSDKDSSNWGHVLFGHEVGEERQQLINHLVNLYNHGEQGDGLLPPQQALLLAWLRQLETPRKLLNMLPALHRQLYYRDYLKLQPQPPVADSVILSMALDDGLVETTVKANTLFDGGTDISGNPLHYALEHDLVVNTGQLTDLIEVNLETKLKRTLMALPDCDLPLGGQWLFTDQSGDKSSLEGEQPIINSVVASGQAALPVAEKIHNLCYFSHPHLLLNSGHRVITLLIQDMKYESAKNIKVELYQQEEWIILISTSIEFYNNPNATIVQITLTEKDKPLLAPPKVAKDLSLPATEFPLLKLSNPDGPPVGRITHIDVSVTGATVLFSTDAGDDRANKPSLPFGSRGTSGSGFNIMSPDWVHATGKFTVTINPAWVGLPSVGFVSHYENYLSKIKNDNEFTVSAYLCEKGHKPAPISENIKLFKDNAGKIIPQGADYGLPIAVSKPAYACEAVSSTDPCDWPWSLRVSLNSIEFKADEYDKQSIYTVEAIADDKKFITIPTFDIQVEGEEIDTHPQLPPSPTNVPNIENLKPATHRVPAHLVRTVDVSINYPTFDTQIIKPEKQPSAPYQPQWSSVTVDFVFANTEVKSGELMQWTQGALGHQAEQKVSGAAEYYSTSTPQAPASSPDTGSQRQLYLGFSQLLPLAKISLYWQLRTPLSHQLLWQYLVANNQWRSLGATVEDNTLSLSRSGLWSCVLPADAATQSTLLPTGKHWIRAVFTVNADDKKEGNQPGNYPLLYSVTANAGKATLINAATVDDAHFATPLPADSIKAPVEDLPDIAKITQRAPSFAGKTAENDDQFNDRVAQRLRHRNRALSWKDISSLLSAKYPEIQALKMGGTHRSEKILVVMPYVSQSDNNDPLRPTINQGRLKEMASYIKSLGTPWLNLKVVNPTYKEVPISYEVSFVKGVIPAYGDRLLRRAIQQSFMPWATHDSSRQLTFGNRINYYDMLALLENQDYVDKVESLMLGDTTTVPQQVLVIKQRVRHVPFFLLKDKFVSISDNIFINLETSDLAYYSVNENGVSNPLGAVPYAKIQLEDKQGRVVYQKEHLGSGSTINDVTLVSINDSALLKIFHGATGTRKEFTQNTLFMESDSAVCYEFSDFKIGVKRAMLHANRDHWELKSSSDDVLVNMYFNFLNATLDVCVIGEVIPCEDVKYIINDFICIEITRSDKKIYAYHFGNAKTIQAFDSHLLTIGDVITVTINGENSKSTYQQKQLTKIVNVFKVAGEDGNYSIAILQ